MIGERLQEIRKDHGDKQTDLAKKLNVAVSTVKSWEGEHSSPSHELLVKICQLYGVTSDYLLGLNDEDPLLMQKKYDELEAENQRLVRMFEEFLIYKQNHS